MLLHNKKGLILPVAIFLMLLSSATVYSIGHFVLEKLFVNSNESFSSMAQQEAENALVYGIYALGTKQADGGHKCQDGWYPTTNVGVEITNEDGGIKKSIQGYTFRRYYTLKGTSDYHNAIMTGIGQVYSNGKLIKESRVEMGVNLLYNGTDQGAPDLCSADSVQMKKETWRTVR